MERLRIVTDPPPNKESKWQKRESEELEAGRPMRDEKGRLLPGHKGLAGSGRKRYALKRDFVRIIYEELTHEEFRTIIRRAIEAAKKNDWRAREFLRHLYLGNKPPTVDEVANETPEAIIE